MRVISHAHRVKCVSNVSLIESLICQIDAKPNHVLTL